MIAPAPTAKDIYAADAEAHNRKRGDERQLNTGASQDPHVLHGLLLQFHFSGFLPADMTPRQESLSLVRSHHLPRLMVGQRL